MNNITLQHGDGGLHTGRLIQDVFYKHFANELLAGYQDAAIFPVTQGRLAFTTDSFVVSPIFFPGGDIGKLAVCGTINDLAAAGAIPRYLSAGFVIEEGFAIDELDRIAQSMATICRQSGCLIVAGDTKVVERGTLNGLHINTAGIGAVSEHFLPRELAAGDALILTGSIAEHGTAIFIERYQLELQGDFASDCTPLDDIVRVLGESLRHVKLMRDPTRGGLATALCEIAHSHRIGATVQKDALPIRPCVAAAHDLLGSDPLYFACEGRMLLVVQEGQEQHIQALLRQTQVGRDARLIGRLTDRHCGVRLQTPLGGERMLQILAHPMLARIC